jgi:hypothetical protein
MDASHLPRNFRALEDRQVAVLYPALLQRIYPCGPRWNPLTRASFPRRAVSPETEPGLANHGLTCIAITLHYLAQPTTCPSFLKAGFTSWSSRLCRLDAHMHLVIHPIVRKQRPDRSGHLVGQGHDHHVLRPALAQGIEPRAGFLRVHQDCPGAMNQQTAQVSITALADTQQPDLATGADLTCHRCRSDLAPDPTRRRTRDRT